MYDLLIITHLPSFYKVRLYNEISKKLKIYVIFIGEGSVQRTSDFTQEERLFDYEVLNKHQFESRPKISSILKLLKIVRSKDFNKLLLCGWDLPEYWILAFTHVRSRLILALESTLVESRITGFRGVIKRIFLSRITCVLASGSLHKALLDILKFKGRILLTKGVGLIKKYDYETQTKTYEKKFLFLGRLSPEKNLERLIEVFNDLRDHQLTIIGNGPLKETISQKSKTNIRILDHVPNDQIGLWIRGSDFLILPSLSEPWGLVVEEALYFGRPVIVSSHCGVAELVIHNKNGFVFNPINVSDLKRLILSITNDTFQELLKMTGPKYIDSKDEDQVSAYFNIL